MTATPKAQPIGPCQARVHRDQHDLRGHPCERPAFAIGNYYGASMLLCRMHHPAELERRRVARGPTEREKRIAARVRAYKMAALVPELLAACKAALTVMPLGQPETRQLRDAIARAEKGQQP